MRRSLRATTVFVLDVLACAIVIVMLAVAWAANALRREEKG